MPDRQQDHPSFSQPEPDQNPSPSAWKLGSCAGLPLFLLVMLAVIGYSLGGQTGMFTVLGAALLVVVLMYRLGHP